MFLWQAVSHATNTTYILIDPLSFKVICKAHGLTRSHQKNTFYGLNLFFCKEIGCNGILKNILLEIKVFITEEIYVD